VFINMPLFELHACVWNYHIGLITNTNVVANKPPICKNKGCYYWQNNNKHTSFSQKNKDKSNEVAWGFLNIISSWCSMWFTPAYSTPAIYSCFFHSGIFHPCYLLLHFLHPHFPPLLSTPVFSTAAFSTLAILPVSHFLLPHFQSPLGWRRPRTATVSLVELLHYYFSHDLRETTKRQALRKH